MPSKTICCCPENQLSHASTGGPKCCEVRTPKYLIRVNVDAAPEQSSQLGRLVVSDAKELAGIDVVKVKSVVPWLMRNE